MTTRESANRSIDAEQVKRSWSQMLSAVSRKGERIVVEQDGVAVAEIVPVQDPRALSRLDAEREEGFNSTFRQVA